MRFLTRTMTVLIFLSSTMGGLILAQDSTEKSTVTISGSATLSGVMMQGLRDVSGQTVVTDHDGHYSATVAYGWSGTVRPVKEGYSFSPASMNYTKIEQNRVNDDYAAMVIQYQICGSTGLPGVTMKGLPGPPVTDKEGKYRATVDYGWSGTVTPTKAGCVFEPPSLSYSRVIGDQRNQDYIPHAVAEGADGGSRSSLEWRFAGNRWEPTPSSSSRRMGRSTGYQPALGPVSSRRVLVVPSGEIKAKELAEVTEDMQVMSHILDERFKQTRRVQGLFTDFGDFFGRDNRQTEAIYLQGYGVLFSMEVNFTFSPQPEPQAQQAAEPNEQVDPTWRKARQEVFQPGAQSRSGPSESTEEQGRRMVDELKKDLTATLKHAANIRGLQPDEWVILTVIGAGRGFGAMGGMTAGGMMGGMGSYGYSAGGSAYGGGFGGAAAGSGRGGMMGGYGGGSSGSSFSGGMAMGGMGGYGGMGMGGMAGPAEMGANSATVLTIRAKKADVDAFAGGELNAEQFQSKVRTVIY